MAVEGPLGLRIPEQTQPAAEAFLLNPEKTKAWIADLPLANVGETSRRVFKAIVDCNRTQMPLASRMQVVEEFREPIDYLEKNLQKHYIEASFPLAPKSRKIALLNRELHAEMAISQKIVIANLFSGKSGRFNRESVNRAIYKTLCHLRNTLLHSYLAHEPCPGYLWREVHRLAAYGFPNSLLTKQSDLNDTQPPGNIHEIYTRILLLVLSAPYELRQRQILSVNEKIDEWSGHARLLNPLAIRELEDDTGLFVSDLASDSPPRHLSLVTDSPLERCVILDTRGLLDHLKRTVRAGVSKTTSLADIDGALLDKLAQVWGGARKRKHQRTKLQFDLKIAVGLNPIWGLLTAGRESEKSESAPPVKRTHDGSSDGGWREQTDMLQHTLKSGFLKTGGEGSLSLSPLDDEPRSHEKNPGLIRPAIDFGPQEDTVDVWSSHNPASFDTHVVRTIDESAGGYCVSWTGEDIPQITIGELLGIQSPTHDTRYALATVRWVKHIPDEGLKLGMQLLAHSVLAVEQSLERDNRKQSQRCLLVPELEAAGLPASLICPALGFQVGDSSRLRQGEKESRIRLTQRVEQTGAFSQFLFEPADKEQKSGPPGSEFDSLWSEL